MASHLINHADILYLCTGVDFSTLPQVSCILRGIHSAQHVNSITPFLVEKLIVAQLVKKFAVCSESRMFIVIS